MAFFKDLSQYSFFRSETPADIKNIGWLEKNLVTMVPGYWENEEILDVLWEYTKISIMQTRGLHQCDLCDIPDIVIVERKDKKLLLGSAEIRVFSEDGEIYAAPNLLYHYVAAHGYRPPDKFVRALLTSPKPPDEAYFEKLKELGVEWSDCLSR